MKYLRFEDLPIWQLSLEKTKQIYKITATEVWKHDLGLQNQIRRAIVSVSSNIVEGFEKSNNNEFIRYLRIAKGSVGEVRSQMYIAQAIGYVNQDVFSAINGDLQNLGEQIGGLISYLEKRRSIRNP